MDEIEKFTGLKAASYKLTRTALPWQFILVLKKELFLPKKVQPSYLMHLQ